MTLTGKNWIFFKQNASYNSDADFETPWKTRDVRGNSRDYRFRRISNQAYIEQLLRCDNDCRLHLKKCGNLPKPNGGKLSLEVKKCNALPKRTNCCTSK